jgi:predicted RNase H-like nuclease
MGLHFVAPSPIMVFRGARRSARKVNMKNRQDLRNEAGQQAFEAVQRALNLGHADTVAEGVEFVAARAELPVEEVEASFQRGLMLWIGATV